MEPRTKKQIIIGSIFALIIFVIAFSVYFFYFRVGPTCADGKQNQGEEGIDCGGPCAKTCEAASLRDINIQWVKALATKEQNYDLIARISNTNQNHGSRKVDYQFKLYDLNDREISSKSGATFILPRQDKYIIELKVFTAQPVAKIRLNLGKVNWEKIDDYTEPEMDVFDKKYQPLENSPPFSQASCVIKNSGDTDFNKIGIAFVLFDDNGNPLAVNASAIDMLPAGQERYFSMPWYFEINGKVAKVEVEPEVNIFK